jgi:hypothetical protein
MKLPSHGKPPSAAEQRSYAVSKAAASAPSATNLAPTRRNLETGRRRQRCDAAGKQERREDSVHGWSFHVASKPRFPRLPKNACSKVWFVLAESRTILRQIRRTPAQKPNPYGPLPQASLDIAAVRGRAQTDLLRSRSTNVDATADDAHWITAADLPRRT